MRAIYALIILVLLQPARPQTTVPLKVYWSGQRGDNFSTTSAEDEAAARDAGYQFGGVEGALLAQSAPGTVPLKLFWNSEREDNFSSATAVGEEEALAAGYTFVRVQGYVFTGEQRGTVPLLLFWSAARGDNFTTATAAGAEAARAVGYQFVRIEGYILSACSNNRSKACPAADARSGPRHPAGAHHDPGKRVFSAWRKAARNHRAPGWTRVSR